MITSLILIPKNGPLKSEVFVRTTLIESGLPKQITKSESDICPKDNSNRQFNVNYYNYTLCNYGVNKKKWLVYSKSNNAVSVFAEAIFKY